MKKFPKLPNHGLLPVARFGDVQIYVHITAFAGILMFLPMASFPVALWGAVLAICLTLIHEIGHAMVCRLVGAKVNFLLVSMLFGFCEYTIWDEYPDKRDSILIAWGGVFAQFVLLLLALLGFALFAESSIFMPSYIRVEGLSYTHVTWVVLIAFNAGTIVFNLAPVAPLDGYKAWEMMPWRVVRAMWYGWNAQRTRKHDGKK